MKIVKLTFRFLLIQNETMGNFVNRKILFRIENEIYFSFKIKKLNFSR